MFKIFKKALDKFFEGSTPDPRHAILRKKNEEFLKSLSEDHKKELFEYIKYHVDIVYAKEKFFNSEISDFFNSFFSQYERIDIGYTYVIDVDNLKLTENIFTEGVLSIGYDMGDYIFIKKNDPLNNIYIETLDEEECMLNNDPLFISFYHYLVERIGSHCEVELEQKYKEMLSVK